MNTFLIVVKVVPAFLLLTFGFENISKPSNFHVGMGVIEVFLGLILLYKPLKLLFKNL